MAVHKREVARVLEEIGRYLQIEERNRFRSRAYINAARSLDGVSTPMEEFIRSGEMQKTPGIGKTTGQIIEEIVTNGRSRYLEELRAKYPPGIFELLRIPGLGLRKIGMLHKELGISSVDDLEAAIAANRLLTLKGFGPKTQQKIAESIEFVRSHRARWLLPSALRFAEMFREHVETLPGIERVAISGSIRRRLEVVGNVNLCVAASSVERARRAVESISFLERIEPLDERTISAQSRMALPVLIHLSPLREFATSLFFTTGTAEFVEAVIAAARRKKLVLGADGLVKQGKRIDLESEEELFSELGLAPIAPELREEAPKTLRAKPIPLVEMTDLQGTFHVHSTYSDGKATIYEMLDAAADRGFAYVGMSDHSPTAYYARGLTLDRLAEQQAEIEKHRRAFQPMRIFLGTESDILVNGDLDYSPEILATFDFVIASIHSRFKMTRDEMTQRILRAVENPFTTILGHLTGRLLLSRDGYTVHYDEVFKAAAKHGVLIEINGNPHRLDLDWRQMQRALSHGVRFVINPDAHSVAEMNHLITGTWVARKGGLAPEHVFNTLSVEEVSRYLAERRARAIQAVQPAPA